MIVFFEYNKSHIIIKNKIIPRLYLNTNVIENNYILCYESDYERKCKTSGDFDDRPLSVFPILNIDVSEYGGSQENR